MAYLSHDIIEANCYIVDNSKLILMSIYVADLINNNRLQDVSATQSTLIRYHTYIEVMHVFYVFSMVVSF